MAEARGWRYRRHDQFFSVMHQALDVSGDDRLRAVRATANQLHGLIYTCKRFLFPDDICHGLDDMETLLESCSP